jgi:hypothetical protein
VSPELSTTPIAESESPIFFIFFLPEHTSTFVGYFGVMAILISFNYLDAATNRVKLIQRSMIPELLEIIRNDEFDFPENFVDASKELLVLLDDTALQPQS